MSDAHDHDHRPTHGRESSHQHAHDVDYAARKHPEFVVLDIGDEVGALIVHTGPEMHGVEVEISPVEDERRRSHKQVLERSINGRAAFTVVFDGLCAGNYTLWTDGRARAFDVAVEGGSIRELDWRPS